MWACDAAVPVPFQAALAHWPPQELHQLATLLHRRVDDYLAYSAAEEPRPPTH
jgi:hypothetical protein